MVPNKTTIILPQEFIKFVEDMADNYDLKCLYICILYLPDFLGLSSMFFHDVSIFGKNIRKHRNKTDTQQRASRLLFYRVCVIIA